MIQPAVQGILCMLKNAMKNGYASYLDIFVFILTVVKISGATYCYNSVLHIDYADVTTSTRRFQACRI